VRACDREQRDPPVTEAQARIAREAYRDFGKGSGHPARLNFGDCFAYALAKATGEPLLFKGTDFAERILTPRLTELLGIETRALPGGPNEAPFQEFNPCGL
jgi:hypothetical protein